MPPRSPLLIAKPTVLPLNRFVGHGFSPRRQTFDLARALTFRVQFRTFKIRASIHLNVFWEDLDEALVLPAYVVAVTYFGASYNS